MNNAKDLQQEIWALSDDLFSVDELEERIELAGIAIANAVTPNDLCGGNLCVGDVGW